MLLLFSKARCPLLGLTNIQAQTLYFYHKEDLLVNVNDSLYKLLILVRWWNANGIFPWFLKDVYSTYQVASFLTNMCILLHTNHIIAYVFNHFRESVTMGLYPC